MLKWAWSTAYLNQDQSRYNFTIAYLKINPVTWSMTYINQDENSLKQKTYNLNQQVLSSTGKLWVKITDK